MDFLQMLSEMHQTGCVANKQYIHANVNDPLFGHSTKTPFFFASAPMLTERHLGILLMTTDGKSLSFKRKCSTDPGPAGMEGGPCDIYIAYTTDGKEYGEIVVNDYCSETSNRPPIGFSFSDDPDKMPWVQKVSVAEPSKKKTDRKKKESKRAKTTGTRKFGILWVVLLLITSVGFNMYQYQKNVKIEAELSDATKEIKQLNNANKDLKKEAAGYEDDLYFLKEFVAVRTRSGTGRNMYHTYGCPYLDDLSEITRITLKTSDLSPCCDWCMRN